MPLAGPPIGTPDLNGREPLGSAPASEYHGRVGGPRVQQQQLHPVPVAARRPAIAGPIFSAMRRTLTELASWEEIRASFVHRRPQDAEWLEESTWHTWVDLERHVGLLNAAAEVVGLEGVHQVGRLRVTSELESGVMGAIVRSWLRTFAGRPASLLRVAPYLWRAGVRDGGEMAVEEAGDALLRFRFVHAPTALRTSSAWRALLAGFADGLFELAQVKGQVDFILPEERADEVEVVARWGPIQSS
jgi:hypothetical protein